MKLIKDIIGTRIKLSRDYDLNNELIKSVWHFYQTYQICLNILGKQDNNMKIKNKLIKKLLNENNPVTINKLKEYMVIDSNVIANADSLLIETEDSKEEFNNFYPDDIIGISIWDREN